MFQRFLIMGKVPELRPDAISTDKSSNEMELMLPVDVYFDVQDLIKELRYARLRGEPTRRLYEQFARAVQPHILTEKDRTWFRKYMSTLPAA